MTAPPLPTPDDVGAVLHARTRTSDLAGGEITGTFNEDTTPTGDQVQSLIELAVGDVYMRVGGTIDEDLHPSYQNCIVLRTAMRVELGFTPEGVGNTTDRTVYQSLRLDYDEAIKTLVAQINKRLFLRKVEDEPEPEPEPE